MMLCNYFKNGCSEKGWFNVFGVYRDFVVYVCLLFMVGGKVMFCMDSVFIIGGKLLF